MTGVAVYAGPAGRLSEAVCAALIEAGYLIGEVGDACDLFVDNISRSPAQAHAAALVAGRPRHYVLISSSHVYPATEHLRPWTPADADIVADLAAWATPELLNARRVEREVRLLHAGRTPLTILRPARIEARRATNTPASPPISAVGYRLTNASCCPKGRSRFIASRRLRMLPLRSSRWRCGRTRSIAC